MALVGTREPLVFGHCEIVKSHWQLHSTAMSLHRTHIYDGSFQSSGARQQSNNLCRNDFCLADDLNSPHSSEDNFDHVTMCIQVHGTLSPF